MFEFFIVNFDIINYLKIIILYLYVEMIWMK